MDMCNQRHLDAVFFLVALCGVEPLSGGNSQDGGTFVLCLTVERHPLSAAVAFEPVVVVTL